MVQCMNSDHANKEAVVHCALPYLTTIMVHPPPESLLEICRSSFISETKEDSRMNLSLISFSQSGSLNKLSNTRNVCT